MSAPHNSVWNDAANARLRELHAENYSFGMVAALLSAEFNTTISRNAVIGRASRIGLEKRRTVIRIHVAKPRPRLTQRGRPEKIVTLPIEPAIPEIDLRQAEVEARHISLDDLQSDECKYPYGDGPFTFCGLPTRGCYCASHFALTHNHEPRGFTRNRRASRFGALVLLEVA